MFQFCSPSPEHLAPMAAAPSLAEPAESDPGEIPYKSLSCRASLGPQVLHFGDGFFRLTRVDCGQQWMVAALAPSFLRRFGDNEADQAGDNQ
jgi:hypothetical protein